MKKLFFSLLFICASSLFANEEIDSDKLSETLGHLIVRHLANPGFEFNLDKVIKGIQDERAKIASPMSEEEYEQAVYSIQETLFLQTAETNLTEANAFLKENIGKQDIKEVDNKLQYKVMQEGSGESVQSDSIPLIHYKGTLLDGSVFASSHETGQPVALPIQQSIPGFAKGLVGMREGEKRILYIHPEFAYGISGHLPPNSLLIFEVEIVKADAQKELPAGIIPSKI